MITTEQIKELREQTGISVMQCKKALEEAEGDIAKAELILKKKGKEIASKKSGRGLGAGTIAAYIHGNGNIGAMVELSCETDFVAKNEEFKKLAYDIAMHVAASAPEFNSYEDISSEEKEKLAELFSKDVEESGKSDEIKKKMLDGRLDSYFKERTLFEQPFVKDSSTTIKELVEGATQKFGERIQITKFIRFSVSEK
ncbi:MAG: translation elongation factor Ts [Patescibacteria group bacterium]|nr:MAG: translation elongation factor Ts [Patescibacteria group bacterium]